jgi:uncharacterized membrane protein YedE/YeeE
VISINSTEVTRAIGGGMLIGAGAATLLLLNGRIAGVSGILGNVLGEMAGQQGWRIGFLLGLLVPALILGTGPALLPHHWLLATASGLMVGAGTQIGSGCTSGHGVCGLANLSTRSLVATVVFMSAAVVTVFFIRHAGAQ